MWGLIVYVLLTEFDNGKNKHCSRSNEKTNRASQAGIYLNGKRSRYCPCALRQPPILLGYYRYYRRACHHWIDRVFFFSSDHQRHLSIFAHNIHQEHSPNKSPSTHTFFLLRPTETMAIKNILLLALLSLVLFSADAQRKGKKSKKAMRNRRQTITLRVTNLMRSQPFSGFFVMVHNSDASLFTLGYPASAELADLAENGNPMPLVEKFTGMDGVYSATAFTEGAPYFLGEPFEIEVTVTRRYPYVTIATMAINTNDMFTAVNGMRLHPGDVVYLNGLDAGSEINNELCDSIPGPACASINATNVASGMGEGYVFVHPGFHGIGNLPVERYDWRNPVMSVEALEYY